MTLINLLQKLVEAQLSFQEMRPGHADYGAIRCPLHHALHTRTAELALPMVYLGKERNDAVLIARGLALADWLVTQHNEDGSWNETPDDWTGTTVFQLMALAALVDLGRSLLTPRQKQAYEQAIHKAAAWVSRSISFRRVTTNYVASGAAGLALAHLVTGEARWQREARRLARLAANRINREGLVEGEGANRRLLWKIVITPRGIDIGYGLEMTLASLALYSRLVDDQTVEERLLASIQAHLPFVFPDGSLDNSLGSRGYKWTIYGCKTAHGAQMALAYGATQGVPGAKQALADTVDYLGRSLKDGLLTDGPQLPSGSALPCLYPSVTRACNLAFTLAYLTTPERRHSLLPQQEANPVTVIRSLNSLLIRTPPWTATVSGYDNGTRFGAGHAGKTFRVPAGGSVTRLYHRDWGNIQAATQFDYFPAEPLHLPPATEKTACFTPRIVLHDDKGPATSVHARGVILHWQTEGAALRIRAEGRFFAETLARPLTSTFVIEYLFKPDRLLKEYSITLDSPWQGLEIIEPLILPQGGHCRWHQGRLLLREGGKGLDISPEPPSAPWQIHRQPEEIDYPLPALAGVLMRCSWLSPGCGTYRARLGFQVVSGHDETGEGH